MTEKAPLALDPADPVHADVLVRLASDHIGWFTTVRADGSPHAVPVWFLWHDGRVLEISDAYTAKYAEAMVAYGAGVVRDSLARQAGVTGQAGGTPRCEEL